MAKNSMTGKIWYGSNDTLLSLGLVFLRCNIGILLFIAGAGKLFGWFGGYGMEATIEGFSKIGISVALTYMSTYTELLGGILLTIGLLTQPVAFAVMINMIVATIVTLPSGFMGPTGAQTPFMFLVIDIVILMAGPMKFSLDRLLVRKFKL